MDIAAGAPLLRLARRQLGSGAAIDGRIGGRLRGQQSRAAIVEAYEFSDIDRTVVRWDCVRCKGTKPHLRSPTPRGTSPLINNGDYAARERYLNAASSLGILYDVVSPRHPGPEQIIETYYSLALFAAAHLSFDYQWINHPAYNRDRGDLSRSRLMRLHAQFSARVHLPRHALSTMPATVAVLVNKGRIPWD